jgi:hypothetical protein
VAKNHWKEAVCLIVGVARSHKSREMNELYELNVDAFLPHYCLAVSWLHQHICSVHHTGTDFFLAEAAQRMEIIVLFDRHMNIHSHS